MGFSTNLAHSERIYGTIRRCGKAWQVIIRKKGHPKIYKTFANYSLATAYAQESEANIAKGLFADLTEANQTLLKDVLQRYKDEVTATKKGGMMRIKVKFAKARGLRPDQTDEFIAQYDFDGNWSLGQSDKE